MEQIPFKECQKQLQTLEYSPILGNRDLSKVSQLPKPSFSTRQRVNSFSANQSAASAARRLSTHKITPRKRLFSESGIFPLETESAPKMTKPNPETPEMAQILTSLNSITDKLSKVESDVVNSEKSISEKLESNFSQLSDQISELRTRQDKEAKAREVLEEKVNEMTDKFVELDAKVDQKAAIAGDDIASIVQAEVARQMRGKNSQINATYYQSLVNDLKLHEKDLMIYGFQPDGSPELEPQIRKKVFKDKLELDIGHFKATQVGSANDGKPKPIRVSFPTTEIRDSICRQSRKLPREMRIDKCLPQRYRQPHREFREYSWQLKEAANVHTRVVFKGHKLVLEFKQHDAEGIRYDWSIAKEYFPEPVSPTDRTQTNRDRQGLQASKTIEQIGTSKVILSNLTVNGEVETVKEYFLNSFIKPEDKDKIGEISVDKLVSKKILIVELPSKKDCAEFKATYEKRDFNGKNPRISVMLGHNTG